ncbi:hypothetical protein [Coleofasciculus sp. LEGE 07092]|uniref:hypothetical protein n=1 Tax=Coleofasciculus sp. LEGE 07092 TaxID=2777969 RepID=UPI001882080A|nr:hypothetical protein [Coleofasciculus sp. LEGE 07092]MBE9151236.1 hypothetical protein [Coleofasciculus sp. LEGE 07092]
MSYRATAGAAGAALGGYSHGSTLYRGEQNPLISLQIPLHSLTFASSQNSEVKDAG